MKRSMPGNLKYFILYNSNKTCYKPHSSCIETKIEICISVISKPKHCLPTYYKISIDKKISF